MAYFDYNSTSPYSPRVLRYLGEDFQNDWMNPSSEYDGAFLLSGKIKEDRKYISNFLNCSSKNIFFTSGATESINSILSSDNLKNYNVKSIISSKLEHHATLECLKDLSAKGFSVLNVQNDNFGNIDLVHFEELCRLNPNSFVSLLFANNETGIINPIKKIVQIAKKYDCLVHTDAVQALGKLELDLEIIDVDFASFSGHKIGSLKGIGLLYAKNSSSLKSFIMGGGQERGKRAGTYNYSAIHSLKLAIEDIDFSRVKKIGELRDYFEKSFLKISDSFKINSFDAPRISNTSNIHLGNINSRALMLYLNSKEIFTSTGSACSSGNVKPSHVLKGMHFSDDYANSCLRISLGADTTQDQIDILLEEITNYLKD